VPGWGFLQQEWVWRGRADDLHEVAELDLNPVIATPDSVHAVDARVRVIPAHSQDPFLRRLR
jgi:hypothetical protein